MSPSSVERFWSPRDGTYALDEQGFLRDPSETWLTTESAEPAALRTDDVREHRCLVLLGEPGTGKSTVVADTDRLVTPGISAVLFDLGAYGSETRLVRELLEHPAIAAWSAGSGALCLVLDSLDEARARMPHVGAIIADIVRRLPFDRLFLRIVCRTADWPTSLEQKLEEVLGAVAVLEILPLRRVDVSAIAVAWCDPETFLEEVQHAGAGPLAARPLTLRFLARAFGRLGRLPERGAALYASGVRSLCEEQNTARRDAGLDGELSLDQRVAVARRVAAATVFGGVPAIWTGPEVDADGEDMAVERLSGSSEPTPAGTFDVSVLGVREAARTGLFTSRGGQRLSWGHATFADFLAAEWVVANITAVQARPLFLAPDGRCWPQTRLAAAWTVAVAPGEFEFITAADPAAFQGEVELPGDTLRAAVIDGLFSVASKLDTARWERSYHALRHRHIADQLRPHLRDTDADRRRLALELADDCAPVELRDDLVAIVTDTAGATHDRVAAGWPLTRLRDPNRTAALRPLALDDATRGDDPMDELKGVCLLASWPQAMANAEVFSVLTPRRQQNYHGAYAMFLERFRSSITTADIDAGLVWLLGDLNSPTDDPTLGALANRVLKLAATRSADVAVVAAFARVVLARAQDYDGLLFKDFRRGEGGDPLDDPTLRRAVAVAVLDADRHERVLYRLAGHSSHSLAVIRADDLAWLAELYVDADVDMREALRSLFQLTLDATDQGHRDLVLDMPAGHPLRLDLLHTWVDAVPLDSPEAHDARRSWEMFRGPKPAKATDDDDIDDQIEDLLTRFDTGEGEGFWQSMRLLTVAPGSTRYGADFDPDVVSMPRWRTLNEELRGRLVDAAERYLCAHPCQPDEWLRKPDIRFFPADAGYRAMLLLLRVAPERLERLSIATWIEWAPILASWSTAFVNGATWVDKEKLLELAGQQAHDAVRGALLTRVEASVAVGKGPFASHEAKYLWNDTVAVTYLSLARSSDTEVREEIVNSLAVNDFGLLRPLLLAWMADPSDVERRRLAAGQLVDRDLERSWPAVKAALDLDLTLAEQVLGHAMSVRGYESTDHVPATVVGDIYLWLRSKFPPETDPQFDDAHMVGPREQIGQWRDQLIGRLRDEGSPEAVEAIRAIVAALPADRWLARTLATAEASLRRNQWTPTPLSQLLRLAADRRTVLINDPEALATAIAAAMESIQTRLTGATPESHYLWDTHGGRPKSEDEISDYIANELSRVLTLGGAIVNREVQIRRNQPSGIGERTDILVDAAPVRGADAGRLTVPVEVKGAWNKEVLSAMRSQLVERYMRDAAATHGIYVIAWPDVESWTDGTDSRRSVLASLDRQAIEAELAAQAAELAKDGVHVLVVHLSLDYRRPTKP